MTLLGSNRRYLSQLILLKQTRLTGLVSFSTCFVRQATEIRSRRPIENDSTTKRRKNTVNPFAQVKNIGKKIENVLSDENLKTLYDRFDPLREEISRDPSFLDEIATKKNPLQNVIQLKDNDVRFSSRIMKAKNRQERYKKGYVLLEGKRLIADAIQAGADLLSIFVTDRKILDSIDFSPSDLNFSVYQISQSAFRTWSDVQTSQGVLAIFAMPKANFCSMKDRVTLPITVICDNVRDPGNLGTIIRSCAAAGCDRLIATKGCVDVWDPKVIRAAMGAHFRLPIVNDVSWQILGQYLPEKSRLFLADHKHNLENENFIEKDDPSKKIFEEMLEKRKSISKNPIENDRSFSSENRFLPLYKNIPIDYFPFDEAFGDLKSKNHATLIVGGETEGISLQARKLTIEFGGKMIFIPLLNDVESLNVSVALSVILMEIRKSFKENLEQIFTKGTKEN